MGNHDFDRGGLPNLMEKRAKHAPGLDILCANVKADGGGQVPAFKDCANLQASSNHMLAIFATPLDYQN